MPAGHVYIATSLDGFVARKDHGLDWLMKFEDGDEDMGYESFMESVDGLIMGRGSYETVLGFGDWPYKKPVVVMSSTLSDHDIPPKLEGKVRFSSKTPAGIMAQLDEEGWNQAYVDGGKLVQSFLQAGLIQELVITTVPVLLGEGISLFGKLPNDVDLELLASRAFKVGFVQSHYRVKRSDLN